jgi:hypothetical protein
MPFCPSCRTEYREGFVECADCKVPLVEHPGPPDELWVDVYTGRGVALRAVEDELERLGIPVARGHSDILGATFDVGIFGTTEMTPYVLSVPQSAYQERRAEIEAAVAVAEAKEPVDPTAEAEAEEDYYVMACPVCVRYFHQPPPACPGCGAALVPAVECFAEGQAAPDAVIVGYGEESGPLFARLEQADFHPVAVRPPGWDRTAVELPWSEVREQTAELDTLLAAVEGETGAGPAGTG